MKSFASMQTGFPLPESLPNCFRSCLDSTPSPALLCWSGWSCCSDQGLENSALSPQRPAWAPLSLLPSSSGGQARARELGGESRALQSPQPGSDREAGHGGQRGAA